MKKMILLAPDDGTPQGGGDPSAVADPPSAPTSAPTSIDPASTTPPPGFTDDSPIPADWKNDPLYKDINTVGDLRKSYQHGQQMIGKTRLPVPGDDATPEEINEYHKSLGRPDAPDKYQLQTVLPKESDPTLVSGITQSLFEAGVSDKQAQHIVKGYVDLQNQAQEKAIEARQAEVDQWGVQLKNEFGMAFDQELAFSHRAADEATEGFVQLMVDNGLDGHPAVVKTMAKFGRLMGDMVSPRDADGQQQTFALSPGQAKQEIANLKSDSNFMKIYMDKQAPGHSEAVAKMEKLFAQQFPEQQEG